MFTRWVVDRVGAAAYGRIVALLLLVSGGVAIMVVVWTVERALGCRTSLAFLSLQNRALELA
jgi:hypothetical protein